MNKVTYKTSIIIIIIICVKTLAEYKIITIVFNHESEIVNVITMLAGLTQQAPACKVYALLIGAVIASLEGHMISAKLAQLDLDLLVALSALSVGAFHR